MEISLQFLKLPKRYKLEAAFSLKLQKEKIKPLRRDVSIISPYPK